MIFNDKMKAKFSKVNDKFIATTGKLSQYKFIASMRDGFALLLPFIIAGSFALIIKSGLLDQGSMLAKAFTKNGDSAFFVWMHKWIMPLFQTVVKCTFDMFTVLFILFFAPIYTEKKGGNPIIGTGVAIASFIAVGALTSTVGVGVFGTKGLIMAILIAPLSISLYVWFGKMKKLQIKMPEGVPPAVGKAFSALFPIVFTLLIIGGIFLIWNIIYTAVIIGNVDNHEKYKTLFDVILNTLSVWLSKAGGNLGMIIAVTLLMGIFWFAGIHGSSILTPVLEVIWTPMMIENAEAYDKGLAIPHVWTRWSWKAWADMGGTASTMGLIIAVIIIGKVKSTKAVTKASLLPGVFNINEPITFGIPIMLNPIYFIPYTLGYAMLATTGWIWTKLGWVRPVVVILPWTTPPILNPFLATGLDWRAIIFSLIQLGLSILLWAPFVLLENKSMKKMDKENYDSEGGSLIKRLFRRKTNKAE